MATIVKLRQKAISKNRQSLYLDFYPPIPHPETGEPTRREFLGKYIQSPIKVLKRTGKNGTVKQIPVYHTDPILNKNTEDANQAILKVAEKIREQRQNMLDKPEIYSNFEKEQLLIKELGQRDFLEYFYSLAKKRKASNHDNWVSAYKYLEAFAKEYTTEGTIRFKDLNEKLFDAFKEYLLTTKSTRSNKTSLAQNSAVSYFNKLKASLKQAFKDEILQIDLNARIEPIKTAETRRNFLTMEELNSLVRTDCQNPLMKRAALFSALTGLRFSDIQKLVWAEVEFIEGNGYFIKFEQQKTKGVETMPIAEQAFGLLGERREPGDRVFEGLEYSAYHNKHLFQWLGSAGITKDITFHCFRHTYAVLQLSLGTDIMTISKMLGHRELKTTQIYANVIDQTKRDATNKIKLDM